MEFLLDFSYLPVNRLMYGIFGDSFGGCVEKRKFIDKKPY